MTIEARNGNHLEARGAAGTAVREARWARGWTLTELGGHVATPISKSQISAIERGRANVTLETLERIAAALDGELQIRIVLQDPA